MGYNRRLEADIPRPLTRNSERDRLCTSVSEPVDGFTSSFPKFCLGSGQESPSDLEDPDAHDRPSRRPVHPDPPSSPHARRSRRLDGPGPGGRDGGTRVRRVPVPEDVQLQAAVADRELHPRPGDLDVDVPHDGRRVHDGRSAHRGWRHDLRRARELEAGQHDVRRQPQLVHPGRNGWCGWGGSRPGDQQPGRAQHHLGRGHRGQPPAGSPPAELEERTRPPATWSRPATIARP